MGSRRVSTYGRSASWSETEAREVLRDQADSGLSVAAFARQKGLVAQRVHWWRKRLGADASVASKPTFLPVRIRVRGASPATAAARSGFEVVLAAGHVVRFDADFDGDALRRIVVALGEGA